MRSVLSLPAFRWLVGAQLVSLLGDRIAPLALAFAILDQTHSATDLGLILASSGVMVAAMLLPAGVVADRLPRRSLMVSSDLVRGIAQAATAALLVTGHPAIWIICILQAIYGFAEAFFIPAFGGLMPELIPSASLQPANAVLALTRNFAAIFGPIIAASAVAVFSAGAALWLDVATFAISASCLSRLPSVSRATDHRAIVTAIRDGFVRDLKAGIREVTSRKWARTFIAADTNYHLMIMPTITVLSPLLAKTYYSGASSAAEWSAAFGIGSILGSAIALRFHPQHPMRWVVGGMVIGSTQPLILGSHIYFAAMIAWFSAAGVAVSFFFTIWDAELQKRIPMESLARVTSFDYFGALVMIPLGSALVGPLANAFGLRRTLLAMGLFGMATALSTLLSREVRNLPALSANSRPISADLP